MRSDRVAVPPDPAAPHSPALTQAALAEALDISIPTLRKLIDEGMPHMLVGDYKRFDRQRVFDWLHERANGGAT